MQRFDGDAVRAWALAASNALEVARGPIDSLNVFPVADADTGTNLCLTIAQGAEGVCALGPGASAADAMTAFAHGAMLGARGNSGVIASQFLLGLAEGFAGRAPDGAAPDGAGLAWALDVAQGSARSAVACPVEGTILTAATAAADAARGVADGGGDLAATVLAALRGARDALARTPDELAVLRVAGVLDAGATGLVVILEALVVVITGQPAPGAVPIRARVLSAAGFEPTGFEAAQGVAAGLDPAGLDPAGLDPAGLDPAGLGPAGLDAAGLLDPAGLDAAGLERAMVTHGEFEVMFVVESDRGDLAPELSRRLQAIGKSVAVVGRSGVWQVHVHTDDPAAAVAAGTLGTRRQITVRLLRPHALEHELDGFGPIDRSHPSDKSHPIDQPKPAGGPDRARLGLVVGTRAPGLIRSLARGGAVVMVLTDEPASPAGVLRAVVDTGAIDVVVLPGSPDARVAALAAAELLHRDGAQVRSPSAARPATRIHVLDAVDDVRVVAGLAAAVTARSGAELRAIRRAIGDVRTAELAVADDAAARGLADELLASGGEVLTLLRGASAGDAVMGALLDHLAAAYPALEVVVLDGGQARPVVAMAVE